MVRACGCTRSISTIWSYDFVENRTHDGRKLRMLNIVDEFTRHCLAIRVGRRLRSTDVIDVLSDLFVLRGAPSCIRSDNGPELIAKALAAILQRDSTSLGPWLPTHPLFRSHYGRLSHPAPLCRAIPTVATRPNMH